MKLYNLFIATFVVLVSFTVGAPVNEKAELKDYVYSSYEGNLKKLKTNNLEYLVKDLDQIYKPVYDMLCAFYDFFNDNSDLISTLASAREGIINCMNNLDEGMTQYEDLIERVSQALDRVPKNPTCYKDLQIFYEDMKDSTREELGNDETFDKVEKFFRDVADFLETIDDHTFMVPVKSKETVEDIAKNYMEVMLDRSKRNVKKQAIQQESADIVNQVNEEIGKYFTTLRQNGILNKDIVNILIVEYGKGQDNCKIMSQSLNSTTTSLKDYAIKVLVMIEKYSTAKFYILDAKNKKKELACEDHLPYLGDKPTEEIESVSREDGNAVLLVTGTDENGRKYKRTLTIADINKQEQRIHEIIEYDNKVLDKKYVVEFA